MLVSWRAGSSIFHYFCHVLIDLIGLSVYLSRFEDGSLVLIVFVGKGKIRARTRWHHANTLEY